MRRPRAVALVAAALLVLCAPAGAELAQNGDLFVHVAGGIAPTRLSRTDLTPVAVRIEATIRPLSPETPPALREIRIAVNRGAKLSTAGLPRCRRSQIAGESSTRAFAICGQALVGAGGYTVRTTAENKPRSTAEGEILLFNSLRRGRPAILAHLYQDEPGPLTSFITFDIRSSRGSFGTVLAGRLEKAFARDAYLHTIYFNLRRTYRYRGRQRSYLAASCATPPGVPIASFPLARVSMAFADGRRLTSTLIRTCRPAGG